MNLKEKIITRNLNKILNSNLYDIEVEKETGIVTCTLKDNIRSKDLFTIKDEQGHFYTVLNLCPINSLNEKLVDYNFNDIKYVISYNKQLGSNVVIKGDTDVTLKGVWDELDKLKVEANNTTIDSNTKIVPRLSINLSSKKSISVKSSIFTIKNCSMACICCNVLNIESSEFLLQGSNLVICSSQINLLNSHFCSNNFYSTSNDILIDNSELFIQELVDIKSSTMKLYSSSVRANEIGFTCNQIPNKSNNIIAYKKISINDKNGDIIDKIISNNIVYNGRTVSDNEFAIVSLTKNDLDENKQLKLKYI